MTLSQEPAISLCNLTTVFNRCILKESGSLPGSFSRPDPWSRKALRVDRTAAAWKQVAYAIRRRRRNPASRIPFTRAKCAAFCPVLDQIPGREKPSVFDQLPGREKPSGWIALRRRGNKSLTRSAAGGGIPQAGFHLHGQNAQHFVPYSTRFLVEKSPPCSTSSLVEHKTSVMWNNG